MRAGSLAAGLLLAGFSGTAWAQSGPALTVDVGAQRQPINRDIYGMNYADQDLATELQLPIDRWGGDATSRYNWAVDSSNAGADWYFMAGNGEAVATPGATADGFIDKDRDAGARTLLTIPIIEYINRGSATDCSFPVAEYGTQTSVNPYVTLSDGGQCGSGVYPDGGNVLAKSPLEVSIANTPSNAQAWMGHLIAKYGTTAQGGIGVYQMDNEPEGWANTHRDIHPAEPTYDEIIGQTLQYAPVVKATDPSALVLGPSDFGWAAYVGNSQDLARDGGLWNGPYYLQQMQQYETEHGTRLLDYFDEHYYPITVSNETAGDAANQALRLERTRSLWDPTYVETDDWIGQYYGAINLLPRFHQWVSTYYPGTKLAITEYNWGGLESINGALAEADVLGIFGREQLDLATLWGAPTSDQPGAFAFRMFLNYDGHRSAFGDTSVSASSADQSQLAIYAAQRSTDGALTLMVINKTGGSLSSALSLANFAPAGSAQVFQYSSANLNAIASAPNVTVTASGFTYDFPANSLTLLVMLPTSFTPDAGTVTDAGVLPDGGSPGGETTDGGARLSPDGGTSPGEVAAGCGCTSAAGAWPVFALLAFALFMRRR
jgi:uncharacterized protein (TIGR03382 family)